MFKRKLLGMVLLVGMLFGQSVPSAQAAICDHIQFVSDLTAPDGATFAPGAAFTKTWRLKNIGTCTWTTAYTLVWTGGDALGTPGPVKLPVSVAPGQMLDISVKLTAPAASGNYKSLWKLSNATGTQFGIGASGQDPFWVSISVVQTSAVIYDFVANAPYAQWKSGAGALPFPITGGDDRGYAYQVNNPHLEDDSIDASAGLLTAPQNKYDGYIQATYPEIEIQKGDQLQTLVNCEFAATSCYVTFRVNYLLSNGAQGTLWSWKEAYDKKFYRKSINLDTLAGKKVRFVFMVFASGSASGDRAIWGAPRILRSGGQPPALPATLTPLPPPAPTLTPFGPPPPTIAPAGCDKATFVSDVTVPDGTLFSPGTGFVKTWRLKNSGSCTWTSAYRLVFYNGEQMGAPTSINIPRNVAPGTTVDLTVNMVAPTNPGTYRGYWILSNAAGNLFGIGTDASKPIWVEVNVSGSSPVVSGYNFVLNACAAQWKSSAGILPCPGTEGDAKGFIIDRQFTQLEDGNMGPAPSLLVAPELKYNGYIQGIYPLFTVLPGDHFRGSTGCAYGSSCYVTFRLDYMTSTGSIKTFWTRREVSDQKNNTFDLDLAPLAGQNVRFILTLLATGSATNDKASWVAPMIVRLDTSGQIPPTVPPTNTPITMPGTIVPSPLIHKLYMLDAYSGWALGNSYVLRTNNGGATWYNVLPASGSGYFPNASRGWVLSGNILYRTTDGGRTWSQNEVPFSGGFIQFINDANGFVLSGELSGMNKHAVDLYQTTDGGTTWTLKYTNNPLAAGAGSSLPFSGHKNSMTFRDTLRGWVGGDYPSNGFVYFYKTNDGGTTWAQQSLAIPAGYTSAFISTGAPKFFNANDAILPVWMTLGVGQRDLFIYTTRDGGNTWTRSITFARQAANTDFVSFTEGFAWNLNGYIQATRNSGASWSQVASNVNFADDLPGMDFVSNTTGWAIQNSVNGSTPLYRTTNGGSTWTLLSGTPATPIPQPTTTPAGPPTPTPVTSLKAKVTAEKLSCRYGPGAEYLYLYALNQTANIKLIGRTDGNNYVWVDGTNKCWVNANYLQIAGDPKTLPIVYPGIAKLPVSPYYPAPAWASATRNGNSVGVTWAPVVISPGKYEDENMHQYILEVWRCEAGRIIFETLGSNLPSIVVAKDEPGCSTPSRGRVFVQEKHGYAGPVEPPWPQPVQPPTSTPASDPSAFAQSIVNTLNTRNFTVLPALMDQSFSFAYWQSQGTSYPPDLAIEQLRTNHLGTTSLTSNVSKDLNTLLGGSNPYSIMGLDPAKSRALFVSGWGLDGKAEAILYVTQRVNGSLYWHSVLIAPTGFVRISTPTSLSGPYAVILVAENDVLNIRSGAGVSNPVVGSFPPDAINVMRTGPTAKADGAEWVEVQNPSGGTGWVNSSYLTEYFSHDAFCADSRITSLIQQLKTSMNQSDGLILSQLTSPKHGINVHLWAYQPAANLTPAKAVNAFTSTEIYNWGSGPRGEPDYGTFKDIIQPKMLDTLNAPNMETYCDNLTKVFPLYRPWPYPNIHYYNLYKPGTPGIDLDFRTWLIGVEYINYQPYIHSMVNIVWEP